MNIFFISNFKFNTLKVQSFRRGCRELQSCLLQYYSSLLSPCARRVTETQQHAEQIFHLQKDGLMLIYRLCFANFKFQIPCIVLLCHSWDLNFNHLHPKLHYWSYRPTSFSHQCCVQSEMRKDIKELDKKGKSLKYKRGKKEKGQLKSATQPFADR